ncbi:MAG: bifunctional UDP-N-acetylglucosamine diphosphorylase/glucosamine-1-phosphate N-acetyltransferase GlmU [Acidobacteriota bacterium]|jgi:bifunctional UDP-N-acetylglucosamine pyrophosphorylase/glucosamine-1-phosphate N-acetyltransferase
MPRGARRATHVVILAAGLGKRMKSSVIKVLHPVAGRPMIARSLAAAAALKPESVTMVLGNQAEAVRPAVEAAAAEARLPPDRLRFALQRRQLGTGHAVMQAESRLRGAGGDLLILAGDVPAIRPETLRGLLRRHRAARAAATVLTAELEDPRGYGRILRGTGAGRDDVLRIVEHADADREQRRIREINSGIYVAEIPGVFRVLKGAGRSNAQNEYYLTDMVEAFRAQGRRVIARRHDHPAEVMGVNDRVELARAGRLLMGRTLEALMRAGVTILDPDRTDIEPGVRVGRDTVIHPGVTLTGRTRIGERCELYPGTRVHDSRIADDTVILDHCLVLGSRIGAGARIGPMAHLRPDSRLDAAVRVGNFVETKKTRMGRGSKANHLTYLGDSRVGRGVNVGAGTITCNYDGTAKHETVLGDGVFIGSDSQLVAPVKVGKGAYVAAGSTITRDVPPGALALSRARQVNKEGWVEARRARQARDKHGKGKRRKG